MVCDMMTSLEFRVMVMDPGQCKISKHACFSQQIRCLGQGDTTCSDVVGSVALAPAIIEVIGEQCNLGAHRLLEEFEGGRVVTEVVCA